MNTHLESGYSPGHLHWVRDDIKLDLTLKYLKSSEMHGSNRKSNGKMKDYPLVGKATPQRKCARKGGPGAEGRSCFPPALFSCQPLP